MKKVILSLAAVFALAVVLVSCNSNSPKASAEKWLNGFYHMDYASAKEVSTEETKKQLESFDGMMGIVQQNKKDEAKKIKVNVKEPKVNGDKATVEYTTSDDQSPKTLNLVKQNGKWLVQWSKMDLGGLGTGSGASDANSGSSMGMSPDTVSAPPADGTMNGGVDTAKH